MSLDEINSFQFQLSQVESALVADPENTELLKLQADLNQVITLLSLETKETKDVQKWKVGDHCMGPFDGKYYEAVILAVGEGVLSVEFVGYKNVEIVNEKEVRKVGSTLPEISKKKKKEFKKKKPPPPKKEPENVPMQSLEQKAWLKFQTGKGKGIPPLLKKPVSVVPSKTWTHTAKRKRHQFETETLSDEP